jgi:hypothetical protein
MVHYDLEFVNGVDMKFIFNNIPFDETSLNMMNSLKLTDKLQNYKDNLHRIVRYDKTQLTNDMINNIGLFRSVIVDADKIVSFSPPKSYSYDAFKNNHPELNDLTIEEYVEGTMINVFWNNNIWNISTKSNVGAETKFFQDENRPTFKSMFLESCKDVNLEDCLNKEYCYSFVMQHQKNRIVIPFDENKLFLVKVYKIEKYKVYDVTKEKIFKEYFKDSTVELPKKINYVSYSDLEDKMLNMKNPYDGVGIMLHAQNGDRTKIRNPAYEYVRKLRGNQPNLRNEYLCLRKTGKIKEFLKYYPEYKRDFNEFREQLHNYTTTLYVNYVNCYIKKTKPLLEYPVEFRKNMFDLHQCYINNLRDEKKHIKFNVVRELVNNLHPAQQIYYLNFTDNLATN